MKVKKKLNIWPYLGGYFTYRHIILSTKVKSDKVHSMTQVTMTMTEDQGLMTLADGQGQRSRSNFLKMGKILNNWPYFRCYFTYRLYTHRAHSVTQLPMTLTKGQVKGQGQN